MELSERNWRAAQKILAALSEEKVSVSEMDEIFRFAKNTAARLATVLPLTQSFDEYVGPRDWAPEKSVDVGTFVRNKSVEVEVIANELESYRRKLTEEDRPVT